MAGAQQRTLTLENAIEQALRDSPSVAASAATLEGAQAAEPSAGRLPDPELIAGVDNLPVDTDDRFSLTKDFMTMRKIGVMQSFPNGTKRRLQRERADREIAVARGELLRSRFETSEAVAEAWISRAVAEQSLARLETLQPDAQLQATAARAALASGRSSAAEALEGQALVASLNDRILSLESEVETQRAELARWLGTEADLPLASIPVDGEVAHSESLVETVAQHAPLAPIVAEIDASKTEVELARADKRPDWSAEITYAERGSEFSDMISLEFRVGLPFFSKHRQDPLIAEKLAAVRKQQAELDAEVRMHTAEVRAALAQWRLGHQRLEQYATELLPLARDRSRAALASYSAGRGDLRGTIDALTEEVDAQLAEVQLRGAIARAWVFLHLLHDTGNSQ
jgi:outer membrane protein TolC